MKLEPMTPEIAVGGYLASREIDVAEGTLQNYRYRLKQFLIWADENELDNMNELTGRKCEAFKNWRIAEGGLARITLEQHLRMFRNFIRWCEAQDAVEEGTADKNVIPSTPKIDTARDESIEYERSEEIVDFLVKFEFASLNHIIYHIFWHTGMRTCSLRALDVDDWNPEQRYLALRQRPETGTPLKLGEQGQRNVSIADDSLVSGIINWIEHRRPDVEDEHGREPLIATPHGRAAKTTIRNAVYRVTRPCHYTGDCPHDRVIEDCEATESDNYSKCPSSLSAHPIRRGSITAHLNQDVPLEHVSERTNVSTDTLDTHYDARTLEERRKNRRKYLDNL